jgi:hypothetical protein
MEETSGGGEAEELLLLLREQEQDQQSLPPHPSVSQLEPVLHHHFLHKIWHTLEKKNVKSLPKHNFLIFYGSPREVRVTFLMFS